MATWIAFGTIRPITERYDKKSTALAFATFGVFLAPLPIFLRLLGWMPENGHPALLPIIMGQSLLVVVALVSIGMLVPSMIADTVDESELRTGKRQEGLFASAISFSTKATSGIGSFAAGIALDVIDFPRNVTDASQIPADKIELLGLAVGPGMLVLYLFTLVILSRYKITRARHSEIIAELERRSADSSA